MCEDQLCVGVNVTAVQSESVTCGCKEFAHMKKKKMLGCMCWFFVLCLCGCEHKDRCVMSGGQSCSSTVALWEGTASPIGRQREVRCRRSLTGHVWCTDSTASAADRTQKTDTSVFGFRGRRTLSHTNYPEKKVMRRLSTGSGFPSLADEAGVFSPCCWTVDWGAVWAPLQSLRVWLPGRKRTLSSHCSQSCHNPVVK